MVPDTQEILNWLVIDEWITIILIDVEFPSLQSSYIYSVLTRLLTVCGIGSVISILQISSKSAYSFWSPLFKVMQLLVT